MNYELSGTFVFFVFFDVTLSTLDSQLSTFKLTLNSKL